jgi:hypothetical protein
MDDSPEGQVAGIVDVREGLLERDMCIQLPHGLISQSTIANPEQLLLFLCRFWRLRPVREQYKRHVSSGHC